MTRVHLLKATRITLLLVISLSTSRVAERPHTGRIYMSLVGKGLINTAQSPYNAEIMLSLAGLHSVETTVTGLRIINV